MIPVVFLGHRYFWVYIVVFYYEIFRSDHSKQNVTYFYVMIYIKGKYRFLDLK